MRKLFSLFMVMAFLAIAPNSVAAATFLTWVQVGPTGSWAASACSTNCDVMVASQSPGEIYVSNDMGANWIRRTTATSRSWTGVAMSGDGQIIYAAASNNNIYKSIDNGVNWTTTAAPGLTSWKDVATSSDGGVVIAAASSGSVYTSIDSGATWTQQSSLGTSIGWTSVDVTPDGTTMVASANTGQIWRGSGTIGSWSWSNITSGKSSTDASISVAGLNWKGVILDSTGTKIAGVVTDYYFSNDSGATWVRSLAGNASYSGLTGTSDLTTVLASNSATCGANCYPAKWTTTNYVNFSRSLASSAGNYGYTSITMAKDASRAIATTVSASLYQSGSMPITSTATLSLSNSPTFKLATTITATLNPTTGGRATFFSNGKRIPGCINVLVTSGTKTCNWKPSNRGSAALSITFVPTDTLASTVSGVRLNTVVGNRLTLR